MSVREKSILPNTDNVTVTGNEILYTHQINRNIRKLLENDEKLNELFEKVNGSVTIREYIEYYSYSIDDLIWFYDDTINRLKILRCIRRNNTNKPFLKDGSYEGSGWKDENEEDDLESFGVDKMVERLINNKILTHENDSSYHKYGQLKNYKTDVDGILMKKDLSNRNLSRSINFYPSKNVELQQDNTIVNGYYRRYDNGLIEYDIVFRLGYRGVETIDGVDYDKIVCNDMTLDITEGGYNPETEKYFAAPVDNSIFAYQNTSQSNYSINDTTIERNRNDYVNVYGGIINFPVQFRDTRYMVFTSGTMAYDGDSSKATIEPCANSITFFDKRTDRISPLLIAYSNGSNFGSSGYYTKNGSLTSNRFQCKIIGFTHE